MFAGWEAYVLSMSVPDPPKPRPLLGCYPHVKWHMTHGLLLRVDHPLWEEANAAIDILHMAQTVQMWDRLLLGLAKKWGDKDEVRETRRPLATMPPPEALVTARHNL